MSSSRFCMYGCNQISRCTRPRARAREPAPVVVRLRATRRPDRRPRTVVRSVRRPSQLDRPGRVSVRTPVDGNGTAGRADGGAVRAVRASPGEWPGPGGDRTRMAWCAPPPAPVLPRPTARSVDRRQSRPIFVVENSFRRTKSLWATSQPLQTVAREESEPCTAALARDSGP